MKSSTETGRSLRRARSAEEYAERVKQALFEVGVVKHCLLYESEGLGLPEAVRDRFHPLGGRPFPA